MRVVLANSACRSAGTKKDNRASVVMADESFVNPEFSPPTCGFNFVFNDGGCRPNVTAAKTVCTVGFRTMPNARSKELLTRITDRAQHYGFEVQSNFIEPFYTSPKAEIVQIACHPVREWIEIDQLNRPLRSMSR